MHIVKNLFVPIAFLLMGLSSVQAAIVNPGFETGDLTGWTANDSSLVIVQSFNVGMGSFSAQLTAGLQDTYTTLSQTLFLNSGDVISGQAEFVSAEAEPGEDQFNDDGYVRLGLETLFAANTFSLGGWTSFSFTVPTSGTYVLQSGVRNVGDDTNDSQLLVDFEQVRSAGEPGSGEPGSGEPGSTVSEPGVATLTTLALLAAGVITRRRR